MIKQIKPQKIEGKLDIGGRSIKISSDAIPSTPGGTQEDVEKGLKKASKKQLFSTPFDLNGTT